MPDILTSRERLLRCAKGEPVDRVPISPPVSFSPLAWAEKGPDAAPLRDPLWPEVAEACAEHCDCMVGIGGPIGQLFDRRFLLTPAKHIERLPVEQGDEWQVVRHVVHTPQGDLTTTDKTQAGVQTAWYTEPLVKTVEDAEALLSVPYEFDAPDLSPCREHMETVGGVGLTEFSVSTPLVSVSRLMHFDQLLLWCHTERELVHRLLRAMCDRVELGLRYALEQGLGPVVWFGGSEQATPPMMGPAMYDEFMVAYDGRLMELVHQHGGLVHVHCHGKISGILDRLLDMGVDMLDPVEPPPDGDITMLEAKERAAGRLTLLGNIEFRELEFSTPRRIDELVKRAILDGGTERVYLCPSATPIERLTPQYRDNALAYIEAGVKYGSAG